MRTTNFRIAIVSALVCSFLFISSCKKKEDPEEPATENGQSTADSREAQSENEAAINDINDIISQTLLGSKNNSTQDASGVTGTICGLTVDSVNIGTGELTLNFNGTTCNNRTRTGSIKLTLLGYPAVKWKNANASMKVEYVNYKVTRASDGKFIMLNGIQNLTNVSGGTWWELLILKTQSSLVNSVTGTNLKVTFTDGKTAMYNINRKFTYTFPGNILTLQGEGIGVSNGLSNLENFGTTRDGDAFTSEVTKPIIWNLTCGAHAPIQGEIIIKVASKGFDLKCTYAVDQAGNTVTVSSNNCAFGWKLDWTLNGKSNSKIFGYN